MDEHPSIIDHSTVIFICTLLIFFGIIYYSQYESISDEKAAQVNACLENIAKNECEKYNQIFQEANHNIFRKTHAYFYCTPNRRLDSKIGYNFLEEDYKSCEYYKK